MICTIKHKGLELFYETGSTKGIDARHSKRIALILQHLNAASQPGDLGFPGFRLHPLKRDLEEFWAINVSGGWRIIFRMKQGDVFDVDYLNYH